MNAQLVTHGLGVPATPRAVATTTGRRGRAPHLTDGYGVVIALTAKECAICATSSGG
jgi:hypothetical protein